MSVWEVVNMSDLVTIETDDHLLAALTIVLLGYGQYAGKELDGNRRVPAFIISGHDEWFVATFGKDFRQCLDSADIGALADVLDSALYGGKSDRALYSSATKSLSKSKIIDFRKQWCDGKRSSQNKICDRAYAFADHLRNSPVKKAV